MLHPDPTVPLTPAVFHILLALLPCERHGYDIMQQVKTDSEDTVTMGPGTLYGSIDRMIDAELVEVTPHRPEHRRRIYYKLTQKGRSTLNAEIQRLENAVHVARKRNTQPA